MPPAAPDARPLDASFTEPIRKDGAYATYIELPGSDEVLGTRRAVKVSGTVDGHEFAATLMPSGDGPRWLPLRKALCQQPTLAERLRCLHTEGMTSITIRDVPDEVRDELAARARRSGRSLQEFLQAELADLARHPDPAELMARVRQRTGRTASTLSVDTILEYRDADRR
jgi:plasmid stability protein